MTSTTHAGGSPLRRLRALSKAEWLQFTRNRVLVIMALLLPVVLPVFVWVAGDQAEASTAMASEMFVLFALGFGVFYPALSMAVTRRDEGVLKRLRTGEARDWEVLSSILMPLAAATLLLTVAFVVGISAASGLWPVNPAIMAAAVVLGIPASHGVALITSAFTPNAENAQITSMPVRVAKLLDLNPFALAVDLFNEGWVGDGALGDTWSSLLTLFAWAVALVWGGYQYMRWDTHR